jgi:tetratricopeptide (TPR) repeat protein
MQRKCSSFRSDYVPKINEIRSVQTMKRINFYFLLLTGIVALASCKDGNNSNPPDNQYIIDGDTLKYPSSVDDLVEGIRQDPKNAQLYYERCQRLLSEKNFLLAYYDAVKCVELEPKNELYHYNLGVLALENNEISEAQTALKSAIQLKPGYSDAYLKLARLQLIMKDYEAGKQTLKKLSEESGELPEAYFVNGMIYKYTGDTASAIKSFRRAVYLDNDHYDSYMQLGLIFGNKKEKAGIDYLNNALRLKEYSTEALYARGQLHQELASYKKAVEDYDKLLIINPEHAGAYYNIGKINFIVERWEDAAYYFNQAVIADPEYTDAYYMRGLSHQAYGNISEAIQNYEACLSLDPGYSQAREMRDYLVKKGGK